MLCLGAHPDDVEIGCGGTLLGLAARPETTVSTVVLTGTPDRQEEAEQAAASFFPGAKVTLLDLPDSRLPEHWGEVKVALEEIAWAHHPDVVFAPRIDDAHQDHRLLGQLASTVWRDALILHYEIPKWDADLVPPTHYVPVSDVERPPQGRAVEPQLPVAATPGLVGRRAVPGTDAAAGHRDPHPVRRGVLRGEGGAPARPRGGAVDDRVRGHEAGARPTTTLRRSFARSNAAQARLHEIVPGGAHTYARGSDQYPEDMAPVLVRGRGARVEDLDGNAYVEYGMGLRSVTLGHGYQPVVAAAAEAAADGISFSRPSVWELRAAETFLTQVPGAEMVKFAKNGSDATTAAVKVARAATGRPLVALCETQPFFSTDDWFIQTTPMRAGIPAEHQRDHRPVPLQRPRGGPGAARSSIRDRSPA